MTTRQKVYDASNYEYLFATGILTPDEDRAAETALQVPKLWEANIKEGKGVLVAQNPSSGAAADIVESIWSKILPFIGIKDRQLGAVLREMVSSGRGIHAYFHSEGSIIGSNNLFWLAFSGGRLPKGSTVDFIGTPITWARAQLSYSIAGGEGLVNFKSSWKDLVTATAFPNPIHIVASSIYAIQYGLEPHNVDYYYKNSK